MIYVGGAVGMRNLGTYSAATAYFPNDLVQYTGSTYIAVANTTGNLPTNTTYWSVLAGGSAAGGSTAGTTVKWGTD